MRVGKIMATALEAAGDRLRAPARDGPTAWLIGFSAWKTFMAAWLPGRRLRWLPAALDETAFERRWLPRILGNPRAEVYVWGFAAPDFVERRLAAAGKPFVRVEDGFLRSVGLGAHRVAPVSLCFDARTLYFDATRASSLELFLQTHDFAATPELLDRARAGIARLRRSGVSKYNVGASADAAALYGPKTRPRVLALGQIDGDMSIVKGCDRPVTSADMVRLAARENPGAQIVYKPHPEVLRGLRKTPPQADPRALSDVAQVLETDVALADALETVDRVYTISSLSGFEALMRGLPVTCLGMPFYAGWGATDDRQSCPRRVARRSVEEIFAAAYIVHARYIDYAAGRFAPFEAALALLERQRAAAGLDGARDGARGGALSRAS